MELLIAVGFFGLISGIVYFVVASRAPVADDVIQQRLQSINAQSQERAPIRLHENDEITFWERVANFFFGDKEMPARFNSMSRSLHQAGYRGNRAVRILLGFENFSNRRLRFRWHGRSDDEQLIDERFSDAWRGWRRGWLHASSAHGFS